MCAAGAPTVHDCRIHRDMRHLQLNNYCFPVPCFDENTTTEQLCERVQLDQVTRETSSCILHCLCAQIAEQASHCCIHPFMCSQNARTIGRWSDTISYCRSSMSWPRAVDMAHCACSGRQAQVQLTSVHANQCMRQQIVSALTPSYCVRWSACTWVLPHDLS